MVCGHVLYFPALFGKIRREMDYPLNSDKIADI